MTSTEASVAPKKANDSSKKAYPLKVVSPIIKKYSGQRQGRIKKKLEFPRKLPSKKSKNRSQVKPSLKSILPKTNAGDVIILESELLPCALNLQAKGNKGRAEAVRKPLQLSEIICDDKKLKASSTKDAGTKGSKPKVNLSSKRKKYLKNLEANFALLKPETEALKEKREQAFAENYLQRVQQKLKGKDDALYMQFIDLICDFQKRGIKVSDLYKRVRQLFSQYSDLGEDFIAFLTPQQAVESGVFIEHLLLTTMTDFLNMIDVYFLKSPQQVKKIHSAIENLSMRQCLTTQEVANTILPLLKGNEVLQDYFLKLLPQGAPPNNFFMDYEEIEYPELSSDISEDEEHFEIVRIPQVEDVYGGDSCPCICHNSQDEKFKTKALHCNSCSVKFINGKIFIQQGKLLRPAKFRFEDFDIAYHRDRLVPKHYPNGGRKKTRTNVQKDNLSPLKSSYHSSDEFKSDIEDEEKMKTKLGLTKSPRAVTRKTASPKYSDKNVARSIFTDTKPESTYIEEKFLLNKCGADFHRRGNKHFMIVTNSDPAGNSIGLTSIVPEEENAQSGNKPLDLPLIDEEEPIFMNETTIPILEKEEENMIIDSPILFGNNGSRSPPVISIPDTANTSLFPSGKPILSFLENLDDSEEPELLIPDNNAVISFDSFSDGQELPKNEPVEDATPAVRESTQEYREEKEEDKIPWNIEEDRIILQTLQVEENCEETFRKINKKIPTRSLDDIKKRFANLMKILYEMKAKTDGAVGNN